MLRFALQPPRPRDQGENGEHFRAGEVDVPVRTARAQPPRPPVGQRGAQQVNMIRPAVWFRLPGLRHKNAENGTYAPVDSYSGHPCPVEQQRMPAALAGKTVVAAVGPRI